MRLYLVRHSDALTQRENPDRPLSKIGLEKVEALGKFLSQHPFPLTAIFHSGKTRSKETAIKLGAAIQPNLIPIEQSCLQPDQDPKKLLELIGKQNHNFMLVGHLPLIETVAATLLTGSQDQPGFQFHECSMLCLELIDNRWKIAWFLEAEMYL